MASTKPIFPVMNFPIELACQILNELVGNDMSISSHVNKTSGTYFPIIVHSDPDTVSFIHSTQSISLVQREISRIERFFMQNSFKKFDNSITFINTHLAVIKHGRKFSVPDEYSIGLDLDSCNACRLPKPFPISGKHGLEKIHLDLRAEEYFAFFEVAVPPFDTAEYLAKYKVLQTHGAGQILAHTEHLLLDFGSHYVEGNDPWFHTDDPRWCLPDHHDEIPRYRANVCALGMVVDWILSYAWERKFLQHIERIELRGNMQPWVREKWEEIFRRHREGLGFEHDADIQEIETRGQAAAIANNDFWVVTDYFPPVCGEGYGMKCWEVQWAAQSCLSGEVETPSKGSDGALLWDDKGEEESGPKGGWYRKEDYASWERYEEMVEARRWRKDIRLHGRHSDEAWDKFRGVWVKVNW